MKKENKFKKNLINALIVQIFRVVCAIILFSSCSQEPQETVRTFSLQSWQFRKSGSSEWFLARVPGSVITDLWRNRKINAITKDQINLISRDSWEYRSIFNVPDGILKQDRIELCFDGLSNSTVVLNDSVILKTFSPLMNWNVSCKKYLKMKGNHLSVIIHSRKNVNKNSVNGIFRSVYLKAWSTAIIQDVFFHPVSVNAKKAEYTAEVTFQASKDIQLMMNMFVNNKMAQQDILVNLKKGDNTQRINFSIEKPKFWWPNGMGTPFLYNVKFVLKDSRGIVDEINQHLAIKTVELSGGKNFYFKINGFPLFLKGAGYVMPELNYPSAGNYAEILESARMSNFNIVRLNRNPVYENDSFYRLCEEKGLLVWQDFIINHQNFSDSAVKIIRTEATVNVKRLRKFACMALWWANDTNTINSGKKRIQPDLFTKILPEIVSEYDPHTAYLNQSSVISKASSEIESLNGRTAGSIVTNFGIPAFDLMKHPLDHDSLSFAGTMEDIYNDIRNSLENKVLTGYINRNYGAPKNFESEVYLTRVAQADIMKAVIERSRLIMPFCMGIVYDRINDARTGISLSTLSFSGSWKPSQYTVRNSFSHFLVIPVRENGVVKIYASSDALKEMDAFLLVKLIDFEGKDLFVKQVPVKIAANSTSLLLNIDESDMLKDIDKKRSCLVVQLNQSNKTLSQNIIYFTEPKNLILQKSNIDVDVNEAIKGYNLVLKSPVLIKNIFIETISGTAWFSENNIDLLPGRRFRINLTYPGTKSELLKDIRIRSLVDIK